VGRCRKTATRAFALTQHRTSTDVSDATYRGPVNPSLSVGYGPLSLNR
jgi:hypothetical protein